jgi:hypothetical protein
MKIEIFLIPTRQGFRVICQAPPGFKSLRISLSLLSDPKLIAACDNIN